MEVVYIKRPMQNGNQKYLQQYCIEIIDNWGSLLRLVHEYVKLISFVTLHLSFPFLLFLILAIACSKNSSTSFTAQWFLWHSFALPCVLTPSCKHRLQILESLSPNMLVPIKLDFVLAIFQCYREYLSIQSSHWTQLSELQRLNHIVTIPEYFGPQTVNKRSEFETA